MPVTAVTPRKTKRKRPSGPPFRALCVHCRGQIEMKGRMVKCVHCGGHLRRDYYESAEMTPKVTQKHCPSCTCPLL